MFSRQSLRLYWRDIRPYWIFAALLFFASLIVGGSPGAPAEWMVQQMEAISRLADSARDADNPEMAFFTLIFLNNVKTSLLVMFSGIVAGILPVFTLVVNGMILGFLFGAYADQGENVWALIAKGILPHGILEIPALLLACGVGVRFGLTLIRGVWGALIGKTEAWDGFVRTAKASLPAALLVTALMLLAAVVESTVTYWLMR